MQFYNETRMWVNDQRDDRPAEYRWYSLFNAAKFGWHPLRAVTLPRRENPLKLAGVPQNNEPSQPLVGWSSPYCKDMWGGIVV